MFFGTGSYLLSQTLLLSWCNSSFQFWRDVQEGIKNELALFGFENLTLGSNTSWRVMKMVTKLTMWLLHSVTGFHPHKENNRNSAISLQRIKWPRLDSCPHQMLLILGNSPCCCTANSFAPSVKLQGKVWLRPFIYWKGAWVLESLSVEISQKHSAELLGPKEYNTPRLKGVYPDTPHRN